MSNQLRERLIEYVARIKAGPFEMPTDGTITLNAESMADALLPFIRDELENRPHKMVTEFHEAFGVAITAPATPELLALRDTLIAEEAAEVAEALGDAALPRIAQELADLVYVAYGTAISLGIDLDGAISEVHRANMSKLHVDGRPILRHDGKVLKGVNYRPPDMTKFVPNGSVEPAVAP